MSASGGKSRCPQCRRYFTNLSSHHLWCGRQNLRVVSGGSYSGSHDDDYEGSNIASSRTRVDLPYMESLQKKVSIEKGKKLVRHAWFSFSL